MARESGSYVLLGLSVAPPPVTLEGFAAILGGRVVTRDGLRIWPAPPAPDEASVAAPYLDLYFPGVIDAAVERLHVNPRPRPVSKARLATIFPTVVEILEETHPYSAAALLAAVAEIEIECPRPEIEPDPGRRVT